jgi:TonB-linked SusC/RagA family outer membrane protein
MDLKIITMKHLLVLISIWGICCSGIFAQEKDISLTISGVVYDETDVTLPGVNIYKKDRPGVGTVSNTDGVFLLKAEVGDMLVFSYLGYNQKEYLITKQESNLVIKMEPMSHQIEEAVVIGLGSQRKISVIGAISNVNVKELQTPATSVSNMLGGRVPGVISLQTSGEPGKNISEFWIRGIGTFGANSNALVLIDGLEGDLSKIDPADIENFSVLKDASATAVYGVRGANGVVLVTTKRGQEDKLTITARANYTISHLTRMPEYLDSYEYAKLANEAYRVRGNGVLYTPMEMDVIQYGLDSDLYPNVNWQDEILNENSLQQTYYINARGGGSIAKYYISMGMSNESAAYKQDKTSKYNADVGYKTYNYRSNLDIKMTKTTKLYLGVSGFLSKKTEPGNKNTDYLWSAQQKITPILMPTKYSSGQLPAYKDSDDEYSPYVMLNHTGIAKVNTTNNNITLALDQDLSTLTSGLSIRAQGAYSSEIFLKETRSLLPEMYYTSGRSTTGDLYLVKSVEKKSVEYSQDRDSYYKLHFETTLNYAKLLNEEHRITGLLYYYMSEEQRASQIGDESSKNSWNMKAIPIKYQGVSGRFTYSFKDTYFIDGNFGYTGSENFQKGHRFGFFPSAAIGWIPTNYPFLQKHLPWLNFLKIRGSYGTVGNDRISDKRFPYLTIVEEKTDGGGWGFNGGSIKDVQIGADNLQWEVAKKADIGIEANLWNDKINLIADYFDDQRDRIFQPRELIPDHVGLTQMPYSNIGKMKSYGADGNIAFIQKINKDASFTIRGNFTLSKNKVQNWEQNFPMYDYQNKSGWPYQVYRGYIALGLFRDEDDITYSPTQKFGESFPMPGDIKYKDVNGDGQIDSDDMVPLSYSNFPRLMYGFGGEFSYKRLTLGILFKGTGNTDFYYVRGDDTGMGYVPFYGGRTGNVLSIAADQSNRWTPEWYSGDPSTENPNARFPRLSYGKNENNNQQSTFWKGNSKYLRLQEISLNYNWKETWMKSFGLASIDLQFVGSNLWVWDNVKLWDPEQADQNGSKYPIPARYAFQLYLNF